MANTASVAIHDVLNELEKRAPFATAEDWDPVGLLVGDPTWKTAGAVVSVDLTPEALAHAEKNAFRLIVTHHPCLFPKGRGLPALVPGPAGSLSRLMLEAYSK